ncbi:sensor histidine kinase [Ruania halotolerans]|uniref:sensor histidine kinase n=1 Tax=Ruania halotolerans TaxID=2897773 RepID=UPI001E369231|nr:histidine kinase [Ruania halotolerans]UFU06384.1 histidine kinase [Ruania halotolerans]
MATSAAPGRAQTARHWATECGRALRAALVSTAVPARTRRWLQIVGVSIGAFVLVLTVALRQPTTPAWPTIALSAAALSWMLAPFLPLLGWRCAAVLHLALTVTALLDQPRVDPSTWPSSALVVSCLWVASRHDAPERRGAAVWSFLLIALGPYGLERPVWLVLLVAGVLVIDATRTRRAAQRAEQQAREEARAAQEQERAGAERSRIARDLHDVVAHHMSLVAVRAETAPYRIKELPPAAAAELSEIAGLARGALQEVRGVLTVLRDSEAPRAPQPGVADLADLIETARAAGSTVYAQWPRVWPELSGAAQLALYRGIQEALSNARRHALGAPVWITVTTDHSENDPPGAVVRATAYSGTGAEDAQVPTAEVPVGADPAWYGHGLRGVAERVRAAGGEFAAASVPDGFVLQFTLPRAGMVV